jgi:1,4-dihydroxy-2-naphthoate octaprenyltransferase
MSTLEESKSVITCDLEGRLETFNAGAEKMFGWTAAEVVGRKRVSLFSPGEVVLGHVGAWLAEAREKGAHESRTVFLRKDGTPFAAKIRITPTVKKGRQVGYCGVTQALPDVRPEDAMPRISPGVRLFKWLVITRAPFLTAMAVPILVGAAWAHARGLATPFPWGTFGLVLAAGLLLHVAANTFNDYFDWKSGTDEANTDYFLPFSGGSRSIELGLITPAGLLRLALSALLASAALGGVLLARTGPGLLWFGLAGAFSAVFYTAPPLRLVARKGLGELLVGLNFGPLVTAGTTYALTGASSWPDFAVGLGVGLLTTAILWINEFPDAPSDAATGKTHLVVVLGKERARWGYVVLLGLAFAIPVAGVVGGLFPPATLIVLFAAPIALRATTLLFRHWASRELVKANSLTIQLQLVAGLLFVAGLLLS